MGKLSQRPIICLSDWQFDVPSQRYFWGQVVEKFEEEGVDLSKALVLVAGDMSSADNSLRGVASSCAPDYSWLQESLNTSSDSSESDLHIIYGNHCYLAREHFGMRNKAHDEDTGSLCLLPHGGITEVRKGRENETSLKSETAGEVQSDFAEPPTKESDSVNSDEKLKVKPADSDNTDNAVTATATEVTDSVSSAPPSLTKEQLAGLSKAERTAYYQQLKEAQGGFAKKTPKLSKLEVQEKQWAHQHPEQAALTEEFEFVMKKEGNYYFKKAGTSCAETGVRIGSVHGIPSSHSQGVHKTARDKYFELVENVVGSGNPNIDILLTHSNPCLPGQEYLVKGEDPKRLFNLFMESSARLHVHGHMHTPEAISVVAPGKIVVNADCRVVVLKPES